MLFLIPGGVQPSSSRNQGRKGKAKDKSKCAPPPGNINNSFKITLYCRSNGEYLFTF